eukprot:3090857-Prymnesium_polylepis.2
MNTTWVHPESIYYHSSSEAVSCALWLYCWSVVTPVCCTTGGAHSSCARKGARRICSWTQAVQGRVVYLSLRVHSGEETECLHEGTGRTAKGRKLSAAISAADVAGAAGSSGPQENLKGRHCTVPPVQARLSSGV